MFIRNKKKKRFTDILRRPLLFNLYSVNRGVE